MIARNPTLSALNNDRIYPTRPRISMAVSNNTFCTEWSHEIWYVAKTAAHNGRSRQWSLGANSTPKCFNWQIFVDDWITSTIGSANNYHDFGLNLTNSWRRGDLRSANLEMKSFSSCQIMTHKIVIKLNNWCIALNCALTSSLGLFTQIFRSAISTANREMGNKNLTKPLSVSMVSKP